MCVRPNIEGTPKLRDSKLQPSTLVERAHAIASVVLHPGPDAGIGVESLYLLSLSEADILDTMKAIGKGGGTLHVLDEDRRLSWRPDAVEITCAIGKAGAALRRDRSGPGRRSALAAGTIKLTITQKA